MLTSSAVHPCDSKLPSPKCPGEDWSPLNGYEGVLSPRVKQSGHEVNQTIPSIPEAKNGAITPLPCRQTLYLFDVSTSNISFLLGAIHRKRDVTACRSSQPITGHQKRPTMATAIWRHKQQHGRYVTTVTGTNNKMTAT